MTTTPAPRRGLFCAHFSALCARFFASCSHFSGFCGDGQGASFLCKLFETFAVFFLSDFFRRFGLFLVAFCGSFAAFFCAVFCFVCRPAGQDHLGQPEPEAGRDRAALFFMSVFVAFWASVSTRKAAQTEAGAAPDPRPCSCTHFQFFLCLYCAISVPPWLPIATHSNTPEAMKNPGIKPFLAKYRGLQIGGR